MKRAIIIVGASGVGKTTVANVILENPKYSLVRSATTRKPREDGNDSEYIYLSNDEFQNAVKNGEMLEFTEYSGNFYGTPLFELERIFQDGKIPLLIVDISGARTFMNNTLDFSIDMFYIYEDLNVIEKRLYNRDLFVPTEEGFLNFIRRKNANIKDYIEIVDIAKGFTAFIKNEEPRNAAAALLDVFNKSPLAENSLATVGDEIITIASSLRESAIMKQQNPF